ncbi:MAG: hypothetical protein CL681_08800 [Blastopirellula sp.]|nr:hypothetical protein [Blastopirellula sp.]
MPGSTFAARSDCSHLVRAPGSSLEWPLRTSSHGCNANHAVAAPGDWQGLLRVRRSGLPDAAERRTAIPRGSPTPRPTPSCLPPELRRQYPQPSLLVCRRRRAARINGPARDLPAQSPHHTQSPSEGFSGLTKGFFIAGSKNLMVSNWYVETYSTKDLITSFFNEAKNNNNLSISKNLNNSMIKFIKENKDKSHPVFWAPFVIVGNDQKLNI